MSQRPSSVRISKRGSSRPATLSTKSGPGAKPRSGNGRGSRRERAKARLLSSGFRSGYEERIAADLNERGVDFTYEANCLAYELRVAGAVCKQCSAPAVFRVAHYTPDFYFTNGTYVEAKGKFTSTNRTRLVAFRTSRPDIVLRLLFQADNWLTSKHKQRYSQWAANHGFESAVGESIPVEWIT